jgi:O-acetyl-ADP-ribose deacetylase (regulator of RNase III)/uncharacterized protein YwgA
MVKVIVGDLFASKAQTLVNTVNCVGVMGKGIALEFKNRFPEMYDDYLKRCTAREVRLGRPYLYRNLVAPWILNFPTKDHWRSVSRLEDIISGLRYLESHYQDWGITSLAVPPLGCGQGQLEWKVVGRTLFRYLKRLAIPVELYAPYGTPTDQIQPEFLDENDSKLLSPESTTSRIEPAWIALVEILAKIEAEPHHWPIGRVTFQKIAYFGTEAGLPTHLNYQRGNFGPYAPELKLVLTRLVNNGLIRERRLGRMLAMEVGPTYRDARREFQRDIESWQPIVDRVADLFVRIRTTQQSELASTVHFAAVALAEKTKKRPSEEEVLDEVLSWKQRRKPALDVHEVALATRNLAVLRWLELNASERLPIPNDPLFDDD